MKMEVDIVSKEQIKPSFPTPSHLRTFKLSLLDQLIPAPYAPLILFYHNTDGNNLTNIPRRLELLKKSLSETLTQFYPLAGTFKDDLCIECNDEGVYFMEAEVKCCLSEFLSQPNLLSLQKFLPCEFIFKESAAGTYVSNVQVNVFSCGGIAVGLCISHKILDGAALGTFLKAWTCTARGSAKVVCPNFDATSLFPTCDLWLRDASMALWGSLRKKGKSVTRRFVFDASAISALQAQATSLCVKNPTRVEAVSAFIWKHAMAAARENTDFQKPSLATHLVNLRRRIASPSSKHSMGNLLWIAATECVEKGEEGLQGLVGKLRAATSRIDGDFVRKLQGEGRYAVMSESLKEIERQYSKDEIDHLGFTSWCNMGFYEADFGWGKPLWVTSFGSSDPIFMNLTILIDTPLGDGIEAWVTVDKQDMARLASNLELLTFASLDPSPLKVGHCGANYENE